VTPSEPARAALRENFVICSYAARVRRDEGINRPGPNYDHRRSTIISLLRARARARARALAKNGMHLIWKISQTADPIRVPLREREPREMREKAARGRGQGGKQEQDSVYRTRVTCTKCTIEQHVFIYSPLLIKSRPCRRSDASLSLLFRSGRGRAASARLQL